MQALIGIFQSVLVLAAFVFIDWSTPIGLRAKTPPWKLKGNPKTVKARYRSHRRARLAIALILVVIDALMARFAGMDYRVAILIAMALLYIALAIYYALCAELDRTPWA